eukprot:6910501-Prymnesium_polylepis.1
MALGGGFDGLVWGGCARRHLCDARRGLSARSSPGRGGTTGGGSGDSLMASVAQNRRTHGRLYQGGG